MPWDDERFPQWPSDLQLGDPSWPWIWSPVENESVVLPSGVIVGGSSTESTDSIPR